MSIMDHKVESIQARVPSPFCEVNYDSTSSKEDSSRVDGEDYNSSQKQLNMESHDISGNDPLDMAAGESDEKSEASSPSSSVTNKKKFYTCNLCDKVFSSNGNLNSHIQVHSAGKPYSCPICNKGFAEKKTFEAHKFLHTGKKPFSCPVCGREYLTKKSMTLHYKLHSEGKSHVCEVCGKAFAYNYLMALHKRVHTGERPYSCEFCGKAFTRSGKLQSHLRSHTDKRPFRCRLCFQGFTSNSELALHMEQHSGESRHLCGICGKTFPSEFALKIHVMVHQGVKVHACSICEEQFPSKWKLRTHMRAHTGEKPIVCPICNKKFTDRNYVKRHLKKHEERNEVFAYCEMLESDCDQGNDFVVRDKQIGLEADCDIEKRNLECSSSTGETISMIGEAKCDTIVNEMQVNQVNGKQENIINFAKSSLDSDDPISTNCVVVEENVEVSPDSKKYGCPVCGKRFVRQTNLKAHMVVHNRKKVFSCNLCNKDFALRDRLKRHMQVHSDNKPHSCRLCGKRYAEKRSLLDHVRRHEEEEEEMDADESQDSYGEPESFVNESGKFVEVIIKEECDIDDEVVEDPFTEVTVKEEEDEHYYVSDLS